MIAASGGAKKNQLGFAEQNAESRPSRIPH